MTGNSSKIVFSSLVWKFLERGGVQVVQFVVSILIARILSPHDYGTVAILSIFIQLATVFVQSGLNTALIQKKDADQIDYSSVFYYNMVLALVVYFVLFFFAPAIAKFYEMKELIAILRVMAIVLFPGAYNALQIAILSKEMKFKKQFYGSLTAALFSGIIGLFLAYIGYGPWALVWQQLLYQVFVCAALFIMERWRPQLSFSFSRTKALLSYGLKLLVARLIDTFYHNIESLIIGKRYTADALAFCNKGKQFPMVLIDNIDGSVQSVMLPTYSALQDDRDAIKSMLRKTIAMCTYLAFPAMLSLAVMGKPLIGLVLGEKWMEAVPYMQVFCVLAMLIPLQTANLQAINAIGRSDVFLRLMTIKRVLGAIVLFASVFVYDSPFAVVYSALFVEIAGVLINAPSNKKLLDYSLTELFADVFPNLLIALLTGACAYLPVILCSNYVAMIILQTIVSVGIYYCLSRITNNQNLSYAKHLIFK